MNIRTTLCAAALGAALTGVPGCSFVLVQGPPAGHERLASFSCTRANVLPILDAVVAATGILVGAELLAAGRVNAWTAAYGVVGGGLVAEGLVFGASSAIGFGRTSRCRAAQRAAAERPL